MRKNSIAIISLAFLASCFMVSCSTEAFDTNQPVKGAKIVIPAQKMSTKAVAADGTATFNTSEDVYICKGSTIDAGLLHPTKNGSSTDITGTLQESYSVDNEITVLYNTNASGVVDYSGQDGSIGSVKYAGCANVKIVSYSGSVLTTTQADIENLQSIFKFTFYNGSISAGNEISGIRFVRIYSNSNKLVAAYDVINQTSTFGPITVSRDSDLADNYIYVALRFDANPSDVIRFEVVDKDDNVYLGSKTAPAAGFMNGIFYNSSVTVTLTPASKMAFRGYEVSTGILQKTGSPATYSLTSGEMTRISGTMNYTLPAGCNPFEPAVYYEKATSLNTYFHKWLTLQSDLGKVSDVNNNINAASDKLPDGWHFPTGGNKTSSDWGKIILGTPKSTITVNGAAVTSNAYATVSVELDAGNSYSVAPGTYYGMFLLRDGSTIPSGYFEKLGSYKYDNQLSEAQFNDLIRLGCLFISASGYYSELSGYGWRELDASWQNGEYWSSTYYSGSQFYKFSFSNSSGVSVTNRSSSSDKNYQVVKLVKPL